MSGRYEAAVFGSALSLACSFSSFQTAHTQPPGTVSVTPGLSFVKNRIDDEAGRSTATNIGAQLGARVGISDRADVGVGSFFRSGVRADIKVNLLDPKAPLAVAPRVGAGYRWGRSIAMLEGGAIASYRATRWFEPYLGIGFANHWIESEPPSVPLGPDVVRRQGAGDGLLQLNVGFELAMSDHFALLAEYGHWLPMNNEPGDFYAFVPTSIAGLALRIGRVR